MNRSSLRIFVLAVAAFIVAAAHPASAQIVALGHSAVHGNVSESEMWPAVLEGLLRARGFGSPTIFIDRTDMNFGNDRRSVIREVLEGREAHSHSGCKSAP